MSIRSRSFRNGAVGSINVTMLAYPRNIEGSITILGETGTVKLGGAALNKVEAWEFEKYDGDDKEIAQANYLFPSGPRAVYGFGHSAYLSNVKDDSLTDSRGGCKSLEFILAIYKSARDKELVALPLKL